MSKRYETEITKVEKQGEYYHIEGTHEGKRASFSVAAPDIEKMNHKAGEAFMKRSVFAIVTSKDNENASRE